MLRDQLEKELNNQEEKKNKKELKRIKKEEKKQKKQELTKEKYLFIKRKLIIFKIWSRGIRKLKEEVKKGNTSAIIINEILPKDMDVINRDVYKVIASKGIENGISVFMHQIYDHFHFEFEFSLYDYHNARYMLDKYDNLYYNITDEYNINLLFDDIQDVNAIFTKIQDYIYKEAAYYEEISQNGVENINEKNVSDSLNTALYRLGYEFNPSYTYYINELIKLCDGSDDKLEKRIYRFCDEIINCIEISHRINKKKLNQIENKGDVLNVKGPVRKKA